MIRSLYAGISGLRNHQVAMDVTSNNIANVNTVGFKSGRVTFEEAMAQLLKGSSRPPGNAGGTNPMQIGLGMSVGSIDTILTQGNLQSTGQITDLAIEGRSYFIYSSGEGDFYSRNGALQLDSTGRIVSPTNGFRLQGMTAASDGTYPVGARVGDIQIPYGEKSPAEETTLVRYSSNLDSDSEGLGSILHTNRFLAVATGSAGGMTPDPLIALFDENGNDLGIQDGDTLTVSFRDLNNVPAGTQEYAFSVGTGTGEVWTIQDLAQSIQDSLNTNVPTGGSQFSVVVDNATGRVQLDMSSTGATTAISGLSVSSNRPGSNSFVRNLFSWGATNSQVAQAAAGVPDDSVGAARAPAESTDLLANVYDAAGQTLGLETDAATGIDDIISINGGIGGSNIAPRQLVYDGTQTMADLMQEIQVAFNLPERDGTLLNNLSVALNPAGTSGDNRVPAGSIVVRGQPEEAFALTNVSISATNEDNDQIAPTRFTANTIMTEVQTARDTAVHSTSIVVYDESGDSHTVTTVFTHSGNPSEWLWEIAMDGGESIVGGSRGRLYFGQDGSPSAFTYDDGSTTFRFNPNNGSNQVEINLDIGGPGSFRGITQFRSATTTAAREQDGYPMGKLAEISINEYGEVQGVYTNGVNKSIARILVAEFNNPAGLLKRGDSMYAVSNNSGEAVKLQPGVGTSSKIKPGALEMSNVELATEFTNMITTQRGYQANARVITTSDSLLQELVQLVR